MKKLFTILLCCFSLIAVSQSVGDSIIVETFNYSQTSGGGIRDTMIDFPELEGVTFEKIIMLYNMRCKDGNVSVPGNTNYGCGEWDYSCNTYIHDSSRVDSVISFTNSHFISLFSGTTFNYVETPMYDFHQYLQKNVEVNNIISETQSTVGSGNLPLSNVVATDNLSSKSQFLFTQSELTAAGLVAGDVDAILFDVATAGSDAEYLQIKLKSTEKTALSSSDPDFDGFTEVYFYDHSISTGINRLQFHTPYSWDGSSNLIVEFSFTNKSLGNTTTVNGETTSFVSSIFSNNGYSLNSVNGKVEVPTDAFSSISEEISISFWSYGNENIQPINNSIFHGVDADNNRQANLHLPWGNGGVYFDCGNDGSGYDRVDKSATPEEYEGSWSHWAVTKNTLSGDMTIYHNGVLWASGTSKTRLIDIQEFILATSGNADRSYYGKIDEFRVWNKELTESTIQDWMYKHLDATHPDYDNLVAYYKMDEGSGEILADASVNAETASIIDYIYWVNDRGDLINRGFMETSERPNISFAQGSYDLSISNITVTDSVQLIPNIVREIEIIPNYGTMENDELLEVSVNEFWEAGYQYVYDHEGIVVDSIMVEGTAVIEIEELSYYTRYPSKYEIMSFVTPYGIYLDLGMEGKTWSFDVSDYAPILKGSKRMTMERGGQRQEDMDIKFIFIVGTPAQAVIDINQLWRADSKGYTSILADRSFEERAFNFNENGARFKLKSVITGHGQQGEFIRRHHTFNIDGGAVEYDWIVWTECSTIPIYPQGGTWIYDRAGWCPGDPSNVYEYYLGEYVSAGQTHSIDYGLVSASGTSNYIVNNQLVTYDEASFSLDASVRNILKPNSEDASQERFNPACTAPEVIIQNTGSTALTSLEIEYFVEDGMVESYAWNGSLEFMEIDTVALPIPELNFWLSGQNKFTVNIINANGQEDEYSHNNTMSSFFDDIHVYPTGELITIQLVTNNWAYQSSYTLFNDDGSIFYMRDDCENNTTYEDDYYLSPGCYQLRIDDTGDNGLEFWNQPSQGEGSFKILDSDGNSLYTFDPDFGGFAIFEFGIGSITSVSGIKENIAINIFPNPTTEKVNVKIQGVESTNVEISLLNSLMNTVMEEASTIVDGYINMDLNMSHLPSGVYFLYIKSGNNIQSKKIVKY